MTDLARSHGRRSPSFTNIAARTVAAFAVTCALSSTLVACGDDDDNSNEANCTGDDSGDVPLGQGIDQPLPAGGKATMNRAEPHAEPPTLDLTITPASKADQQAASDLQIDETFKVAGTTYSVVGVCEDAAYLDQLGGGG